MTASNKIDDPGIIIERRTSRSGCLWWMGGKNVFEIMQSYVEYVHMTSGREAEVVAYVITEPCIGTKDASCLEVCPVDCIDSNDESDQYFIDPSECIDCGACVDTCPVEAIYSEDEVPEQWASFIKLNETFYQG